VFPDILANALAALIPPFPGWPENGPPLENTSPVVDRAAPESVSGDSVIGGGSGPE